MENVNGAYSTVLATREELYMFRDPNAIRPMVWGIRSDGVVVASSESCALDILGIRNAQEVRGGEIIISGKNGVSKDIVDTEKLRGSKNFNHCIFEHVYFSRPDSFHFGENVYQVRQAIGYHLAEDDDCEADMVVPVPDSANFIALGYARRKGIPYEMGLIRNHYVGRTFIKPEQTIRDESVHQKFNTLPNFFKDKKIVLIDDSIVRGTTIRNLIRLIKNSGAKEVHLRIGSPQVKFSCYYGIDTPTKAELVANKLTLEEIRKYIDADSIKHLSIDRLRKTVHKPDDYCFACFNGNYPIKPETENLI
jgi:amidophosphoribosyltransferase